MCAVATLIFGALAFVAIAAAIRTELTGLRILNGLIGTGLAVLAGYALASLQLRTRLDASGATAIWPFSRRRLAWDRIDRLDVAHLLPGWTVRGWSEDRPVVLFVCHDTSGRRPRPETYDTPPPEAGRAMRDGYVHIERYWRDARR
jgi:hypothetical protein